MNSCIEKFSSLPNYKDELCEQLISSSLIDTYGIFACDCNLIGSFSNSCDRYGGQCYCRKNSIVNRKCDKCAPKTWGFSVEKNICQRIYIFFWYNFLFE